MGGGETIFRTRLFGDYFFGVSHDSSLVLVCGVWGIPHFRFLGFCFVRSFGIALNYFPFLLHRAERRSPHFLEFPSFYFYRLWTLNLTHPRSSALAPADWILHSVVFLRFTLWLLFTSWKKWYSTTRLFPFRRNISRADTDEWRNTENKEWKLLASYFCGLLLLLLKFGL